MTRSIAIDFVTQGIRCNAICPGTVQTPFVEGYLSRNFAGHEDEARQHVLDPGAQILNDWRNCPTYGVK